MKRLLILSCSQSKRTATHSLPAYERYDGPTFRLLRRYLKTSTDSPIIRILSAEYGLISHDKHIPFYERRMTAERAQELQPQVKNELNYLLDVDNIKTGHSIFVHLGKKYWAALQGSEIFCSACVLKIATGTRGKQLADLYTWLYGAGASSNRQPITKQTSCNIRMRGVDINCVREEALEKARCAIQTGGEEGARYHAWYVLVNNTRVSPKWLVSILTGLPVRAFHSDEARRVLSRLGVEVLRA